MPWHHTDKLPKWWAYLWRSPVTLACHYLHLTNMEYMRTFAKKVDYLTLLVYDENVIMWILTIVTILSYRTELSLIKIWTSNRELSFQRLHGCSASIMKTLSLWKPYPRRRNWSRLPGSGTRFGIAIKSRQKKNFLVAIWGGNTRFSCFLCFSFDERHCCRGMMRKA